tara:strand:+ start:199 stop:462 length:264 start_codon:yes stop_codon:yes gene_type:complete
MRKPLINVIAVANKRTGELKVFIQSWLNQTDNDWSMTIINDGECKEFAEVINYFNLTSKNKITFHSTKTRHNDFGHTLREIGLKDTK